MALSERAGFWTAASVAGLALWASGAPTVVYPLYAEEWQLQPSVTTAIFAIYPIVLVPVLIVFGNLSDVIGRRAVILMGLGALTAGSIAFGLAPDLTWVFIGRALMGVGVGLSLSPATAAMVEFGGPRRRPASEFGDDGGHGDGTRPRDDRRGSPRAVRAGAAAPELLGAHRGHGDRRRLRVLPSATHS